MTAGTAGTAGAVADATGTGVQGRGAALAALAAPAAAGVSGPALVVPEAAASLGVSVATATWLLTVFGIGMAAGTPLLTAAGRRGGPGGTLRAAAALVVAGTALVLLVPGFAAVLAGRALLAAGAAGFNVAAFQLAGRDRSGRSAGLVAIGSATGGTAGLFGGAAIAAGVDWRAALVLPVLSLAVLGWVRSPGAPAPDAAGPRRARGGTAAVLRSPAFLSCAGLVLALSTVNFGLMYAGPRRAGELAGWGVVETGAYAAVAALAGALLSWVLVRARARWWVLACGGALAVALAAGGPRAWVVLLGSGVSSLATAAGQGLLTGASTEGLPEELHDTAVGLFNFAFLVGVAAGPALASTLY
ncbi:MULTISPECIES: MFS transporter [Streptomyces]|uniref:MFS transporter n=2 Tax=Streptomyces TaxID=1883 RepID=A0ABU4KD65_9ACTN|nr:MFS transporter [Streptomyces roseolus]MDX2295709.1 MFS transporter [Streptomyces roseolus]